MVVFLRFATKRYNAPKFSYKISPSFIFLKSYKIISKSDMRLEVLMGNKISEKFVLTNEGIIKYRRNDVEKDIDSFAFGGAWVC
jgi:hypothetical protein